MKISTLREFRDGATVLLRSSEPILITRRGRMAGIYFPAQEGSLPVDLKRELFTMLTTEIARQIKAARASEQTILTEFDAWRKERRARRRRR
jgi:hypothetical protein